MGAVFEVVGVRGIGGGCNVAELGSINGGMKRPCHLKKKEKRRKRRMEGRVSFYFLAENKFWTRRLKEIKRNPSAFDV